MKKAEKELKGKEEEEGIGNTFLALLFGPSIVSLPIDFLVNAGAIGDPFANTSDIIDLITYGVLGVWTLIVARVFFVGFLEERNEVIAQNIRNACLDAKP